MTGGSTLGEMLPRLSHAIVPCPCTTHLHVLHIRSLFWRTQSTRARGATNSPGNGQKPGTAHAAEKLSTRWGPGFGEPQLPPCTARSTCACAYVMPWFHEHARSGCMHERKEPHFCAHPEPSGPRRQGPQRVGALVTCSRTRQPATARAHLSRVAEARESMA